MRRREFIGVVGTLALGARTARAQDRTQVARIGFLGQAPASGVASRVDALREGLRELGYVEGRNLVFEFRWAETPQLMPALAGELVRERVDVIFAPTSTETAAALDATRVTPIVFAGHADPVGIGHVASLAKPGGNATGLTQLLTDIAAKQLEALKEAVPGARRFGVLYASTAPSHIPALRAAEASARSFGVELRATPVGGEADMARAFAEMATERLDGVLVLASSLTLSRRALLADLAIQHRLASAFGAKDNVVAGGLLSYAPDARDLTRRAAAYIDRILKGERPADLPVEQATRYQLLINMKTASALGLVIPPALLARADEVIE